MLADVEAARVILRAAPTVLFAGEAVADLRGQRIPELPEAAAREGIGFLASMRERDGRRKRSIMGAGPDAIAAWIEQARADGLIGVYGDPARGFAGGYR